MSRKRVAGTFERMDPANPNVIEVIYKDKQPDPPPTRALSSIGHEPQQQIGGREVDDVLFGGVAPRSSSNTHGQSDRRSDNWAQGINLRGNPDDPVMPSSSFLRDAYMGTPFDLFNFDAMKRHIQRQVEWMTTDVGTLIAGIQMHTNRPMSELILNGSFFNAGAKDFHELHSGGGLGSQIIGPMLAQLVNSVLSGKLAQSLRSTDDDDDEFIQRLDADLLDPQDEEYEFEEMGDEEWEPLVSVGKNGRDMWLIFKENEIDPRPVKVILREHWNQQNPLDQVADFTAAPKQKQVEIVKKAVQDGVASSSKLASNVRQLKDFHRAPQQGGGIQVFGGQGRRLNASIASHIESNGVSHQSAIRVIQKMRNSMQRIGPNGGLFGDRGPQDDRPPQDRILEQVQAILSQDAQAVATQRWLWNSLPENSGITAVAPDVKFAIEEAFENIRGISGKEHFKLIHLIRSPRVRSKFAAYVASLMNVVPGHIAYANGVSGRGRTSYKVSAGVQLRRQNAKLGRAGLLWFESVGYSRNPTISDAQQKISAAISRLDEARQILEAKILEILAAKAEIWGELTQSDKGVAWAMRSLHKEMSKDHNKWIEESNKEQDHKRRRETASEAAAGARKDAAKSRMERGERLIEWIINDRTTHVPEFRVEGLRRALWPHAWTWFDLFGADNAEWQVIVGDPVGATITVYLPPLANLNGDAEAREFDVEIYVSPMLEPRNYVKLDVALELAKTETMKAFRDASIWGNRGPWATTHSPKLRRVLDLMSEVQTSARLVDTLTKDHLEATRLLGGMSEDDKVVLVKNTNSGRRHKVRRLVEGGSYAEAEEGYFPQPMILLDNYEMMAMGVQPYRARGTFN